MNLPKPSFSVNVDVTNPGQFFACCGLLELAHRLWHGAEGWFDGEQFMIAVHEEYRNDRLTYLVKTVSRCDISGLSEAERKEREELERQRRELERKGGELSPDEEKRRAELGRYARKGVIRLGEPLGLLLDWWDTDDDEATPKTWAGLQELHKIVRAAQDALSGISDLTRLFDYGCVLRVPEEYRKGKSDSDKSVEPFCFDARRSAHPLDAGFSLDVQEAETMAYPAVELLSLVGLQRFRPANSTVKWSFDYCVWSYPLSAPVAAAVSKGASPIPMQYAYRFPLRFREDQKRYKVFGYAILLGG